MTISAQDQKEYDERQKHKPTSYVPDHLIPPQERKRPHGSFADFERAMDGHVVNIIGQGKNIQVVGEGYQDQFQETMNEPEDTWEETDYGVRRNSRGEQVSYPEGDDE